MDTSAPSLILIVDDETKIRRIVASNLERAGYGERQKFCVHGIIGARQTGASNEHEHQTQFS